MFERIVVPVDGSSRSLDAVRIGSLLAGDDASFEAVTVVAANSDVDAEVRRLSEQLEALGEARRAPRAVVLPGASVAETLAGYVTGRPGTGLVMSSTGRDRSAAVLGSVADELLASDVGPILVVGPHATERSPFSGDVIVALDGSRLSESALDVAASWCAGRNVRLWVVTVVTLAPGASVDLDVSESSYVRRKAEELHDRVHRPVEFEVLHGGSPARALVDFAGTMDAGMIVMSTHGRSGLRRIVLGSVAAEVIHQAPCPVLVQRPESTMT